MTILPQLGACKVRDVWALNFEMEFEWLLVAAAGDDAVIAIDFEFPGCVQDMPFHASRAAQHALLCDSVDLLQPIQLGIAVAVGGIHQGAWNFNLNFDLSRDLHTDAAVAFLRKAGIDFPRHATEGVEIGMFGARLAASPLFAHAGDGPRLVTFAGIYDLGYLMKLLTDDRLPRQLGAYDAALADYFPRHCELREFLPYGSLQRNLEEHSVTRIGMAHTAGSDALATLELFATVVPDASNASSSKMFVTANPPQQLGSGAAAATTRQCSIKQQAIPLKLSLDEPVAAPRIAWGSSARAAMLRSNEAVAAALAVELPQKACSKRVFAACTDQPQPAALPSSCWGASARLSMQRAHAEVVRQETATSQPLPEGTVIAPSVTDEKATFACLERATSMNCPSNAWATAARKGLHDAGGPKDCAPYPNGQSSIAWAIRLRPNAASPQVVDTQSPTDTFRAPPGLDLPVEVPRPTAAPAA